MGLGPYRYIVTVKDQSFRVWQREVTTKTLDPALAIAEAFDRIESECDEGFPHDKSVTVECRRTP